MPLENMKALAVTDRIAKILSDKQCPFSIFTTAWPKVWDNYTEAWVIGGDGTLNHFINQNPDFLLPISIFKEGSRNDFHSMIYSDITVEAQVEKVLYGAPHPVDAGSCNNSLFLNGLGIGFDGAIVKDLVGKRKVAGKASYLLSILKKHLLLPVFSLHRQHQEFSLGQKMFYDQRGQRKALRRRLPGKPQKPGERWPAGYQHRGQDSPPAPAAVPAAD